MALLPGFAGPASALENVTLLGTSPSGVRFEIAVPDPTLVPIDEGSGLEATLPGWFQADAPGSFGLPERVFMVAVPPSGDVQVTGEVVDSKSLEDVRLGRVPTITRDGERIEAEGPVTAEPAEVADLLGVSWFRDQRVARIRVRPARYDVAARRFVSASRVRVSVSFEPAVLSAGDAGAGASRGIAPLSTRSSRPELDAFENVYASTIVNLEQGRPWRRPAGALVEPLSPSSSPRGALSTRSAAAATLPPDTSVFVGRQWVKISITRTGFYKLPYSSFRSLAPFNNDTTITFDSLRLFTWEGEPTLPENDFCDSCGFREVAIGTIGDMDGRLNSNSDAIYFYGLGASDWADHYDSSQPDTVFLNNPYELRNVYFLTVSTTEHPVGGTPRRIGTQQATLPSGGETAATTFTARTHQELDTQYFPDASPLGTTFQWEKWFWARVTEGNSFNGTIDAPGADTTAASRLRLRMWSLFKPQCTDPRQFVDVSWNGTALPRWGWFSFTGTTVDAMVTPTKLKGNTMSMRASDLRCDNDIGVAWFDLFYPRRYQPVNGTLEFLPPSVAPLNLQMGRPTGSLLRQPFDYEVGPFTTATRPRLFDISDPLAPVEIVGFGYAPVTSGYQMSFSSIDGVTGQRYLTLPDTAFVTVTSASVTGASNASFDNLRSHTQQADYLVIYYDQFQAAADTLASWRRVHNGFRTKTVAISAIYDQFSGGRTDPTAIRNFLRAAYAWSVRPTYVTMLGDASYDFKNITGKALPGQPGTPLPTYENSFETSSFRQYTTDDWLLNVDNPNQIVPDYLGGRLPVPDATTALDVVRNKVRPYERTSPIELFRNRVMLVADDNEQGSKDDPLRWNHVRQSHVLDSLYVPSTLDREYVYLHTFPDGPADTKPGAKNKIISEINGEGIAVYNYIGHGSPYKMADESVFLDTDAGALTNAQRLPLWIAASCDVGRFSDPSSPSLGEQLMVRSGGGGIGVISATDLAYSGQNAELNQTVFRSLFGRVGGKFSGWVAEALLDAKLGSSNNQKYQLMGDAATRINLPTYWVEVTVRDAQNRDTTSVVQGERMKFEGRVLDGPGGPLLPFDGNVDVLIEDSKPLLLTPPCNPAIVPGGCESERQLYLFEAGPVFRGQARAQGGVFQGEFIVPLEARQGQRGRIRAYVVGQVSGRQDDAVGDERLTIVGGTGSPGDTRGPDIHLSFPNGALTVRPDAVLRIDLSDSSGILITGHTLVNGIIVTVDDNSTTRADVTSTFRYGLGSYQSGSAEFKLPNLPDGVHHIKVSAADNLAVGLSAAQHRSEATLEFTTASQLPLRIERAYLFPNPTRSGGGGGGRFVVDTQGGPANLLLRIYTSSGRLIRTLSTFGTDGQAQVAWDGLDGEGQALSNGLYLFKVHANSQDASGASDASQKSELEGRFVILNH